jgi:hydrogenase maturation protease
VSRGILVAGIGNVFLGDDGFGVEVVRRLAARSLGAHVTVADFGIRGFDLAFAMLDGYGETILVDALPRGGASGTLYVIEPAQDDDAANTSLTGHTCTPVQVLALVRRLGGTPGRVRVVGCEPAMIPADDDLHMGLSAAVAAAVDPAVELVAELVAGSLQHA